MSYILDALKKSERERQRKAGLDQMTGPDMWVQQSRRRPFWLYLLVLAIVVNAVVIMWWIGSWQSSQKAVVPSASQQPQTDAGPSGMVKDRPLSPAPFSGTPFDQERNTQGSRDAGKGKAPQAAKVLTETPERSVTRKERSETAAKRTVRTPESESIAVEVQESPDIQSALQQAVAPAETSPPEPQAELPTGTIGDKRVYSLQELPLLIQKSLPEFSISVYLHSDEPASRMARINSRMMREGQDLTPGLRLEEITPDSAIFSYRNYRFRIGLK